MVNVMESSLAETMVSINLQKKATPIKCTARKNLTPVDANKSLEDVKTIKQKVRSTIY